jgi:hypothetical protein
MEIIKDIHDSAFVAVLTATNWPQESFPLTAQLAKQNDLPGAH